MKLITKEIAAKLFKADQKVIETGEGPDEIAVKFFTPWANATWFITSGTPLDSQGEPCEVEAAQDWHLFGFCDLGDPISAELGYVLLSQLEELKGPVGLKVERDRHFTGSLKEVMAKYR